MLSFYQHISERINPIAFSIGSFNIRWYSMMYLVGFAAVYFLLVYRLKKNELKYFSSFGERLRKKDENLILDFLIYAFGGLIIGARLGHVLFYNLEYFVQTPFAIISPFDFSGNFVGIFGMSYFGGLLGIILASILFCRKNKINFWQWADFVIPAIPAGYFFGRIGNFLNGELYGKVTDSIFGMYFSGVLRYPTQLMEAFFEGIVLFAILWLIRNRFKFSGSSLSVYLLGYGIIRFFVEFLREPEGMPFFGFTMGQILSLAIIIISVIIFLHKTKKPWYNSLNA